MEEQLWISNANDFIFLLMLRKYIAASAPPKGLSERLLNYFLLQSLYKILPLEYLFPLPRLCLQLRSFVCWLVRRSAGLRINYRRIFIKLGWRMRFCTEETPLAFGLILINCNSIKHLKILKTDHT